MMPAWLDLLRTPLAAPETRQLRRMRRTWQALCIALALVVLAYPWLHQRWNARAAIPVAALLAATIVHGTVYAWRKHRADDAFLALVTQGEE